jgi:mannan endo-1,4-beta-mannosidase
MTSPPPAAPSRGHRAARSRPAAVTRIIRSDDLPSGVNALASADGKTVIVRASLDQQARRRAVREVMASIRRFPVLGVLPAVAADLVRQVCRRVGGAAGSAAQSVQQLASSAGEHLAGVVVAVTAAVGTVAAVTAVVATSGHDPQQHPVSGGQQASPAAASAAAGRHRAVASLPPTPLAYLGAYADGLPGNFGGFDQFAAAIGKQPNIALYYSSWDERFKIEFADQAAQAGATPAVQIEPFGVSLADIAAGKCDKYLISYADQVRSFGGPVIIGFGHEPNGGWYPWGIRHVQPTVWIAAWRHIVDVFRAQGADNVIWLWTVNAQGQGANMAAAWWPGSSYVSWIGLDGYFAAPGDRFRTVFGTALGIVQGFGRPVLIAETAVGPGTGDQPAKIRELLHGVRAHHLLGLIWFDKAQDSGPFHQDWQLRPHTPATAAFRRWSGYLSP